MIFITGDVHCPIDVYKLKNRVWTAQKDLTRNDYLIICGDMGIVWALDKTDLYWQLWFEHKNFTTLFIDGNHENHNALDSIEVEMQNGGKIHRVMPYVIHLMRGQIYDIEGLKIFTFGGASSHDKEYRIENVSWWRRELPDVFEMDEARENLECVDNKVDLITFNTCSCS